MTNKHSNVSSDVYEGDRRSKVSSESDAISMREVDEVIRKLRRRLHIVQKLKNTVEKTERFLHNCDGNDICTEDESEKENVLP